MSGPIILDPDYYDHKLLSTFNERGLVKVVLGPARDLNLQLAFERLLIGDMLAFLDLVIEMVQEETPDGVVMTSVTSKVYKLTEKGFARKAKLALKFA